jgi:predicted DNA-binding transcriptional regulator YafY
MRADRLLSALLLLQAHGKQTGRELAARLAVSERTIHRDMEALSAAGVPVFALRGTRGGWQLDEQWRTEVPGLDEAELRAFLMAQPRIVGDKYLAAAAERALDKLLAALPLTLRRRAAAMRQRLYVDTTGWYGRADDLSALPAVQDALSRDRKLQITYAKPIRGTRERVEFGGRDGGGGDVYRVIDPLGLVAKGATWYLVAQTSKGYRTFRVSRITSTTVLETPCERPSDFDLAAHWTASTTQFIESRRQFAVTLRMAPTAAEKLKHWFHHTTVLGPSSPTDKSIVVQVKFDDEQQAAFVVLGFGRQAEVLAPASLRERVDEEIAALARRSGGSGRSGKSGRSGGSGRAGGSGEQVP